MSNSHYLDWGHGDPVSQATCDPTFQLPRQVQKHCTIVPVQDHKLAVIILVRSCFYEIDLRLREF